MTEENMIPPSDEPVRIRWLNAAEQNQSVAKPVPQHPSVPTIKTTKVPTNKVRTKVPSANNAVRFAEPSVPTTTSMTAAASSVDMSIQSSKGIKELSAEDKLKIANLIKELARLGHEKELMEGKLEQERRLFETQMKTVLVDYDKLMKDNQKLLTRYHETKSTLDQYEKKLRSLPKPSSSTGGPSVTEFPNPQRSSTPIHIPTNEPTTVSRSRTETPIQVPPVQQQLPARAAPVLLQEQFQLKQMMMEKQLELLQKQQQILEQELHQKNLSNHSQEEKTASVAAVPLTGKTSSCMITRSTSPMKGDSRKIVVERATSPVKRVVSAIKSSEKVSKRPIQTQRVDLNANDEDLLILSLNESLHEPIVAQRKTTKTSVNTIDSEEQNLLKDIFFIC